MNDKLLKYTAGCAQCDWLNYLREGDKTFSDKYLCELKREVKNGNEPLCENFEIRSGLVTKKTYPKK